MQSGRTYITRAGNQTELYTVSCEMPLPSNLPRMTMCKGIARCPVKSAGTCVRGALSEVCRGCQIYGDHREGIEGVIWPCLTAKEPMRSTEECYKSGRKGVHIACSPYRYFQLLNKGNLSIFNSFFRKNSLQYLCTFIPIHPGRCHPSIEQRFDFIKLFPPRLNALNCHLLSIY